MKIKKDFVLQEIMEDVIVVPIGEEADRMNGVIRLNHTGAFLWDALTENDWTEDDLITAMMEKYMIDRVAAQKDVSSFIDALRKLDVLHNSTIE